MNSKYNLSNTTYFTKKFDITKTKYLFKKHTQLISEFLLSLVDSISLTKKQYYLFVIQRGLETIMHCFKILFMYTKNIDLTVYHCKKAFCYYIEFIGQISDNNHSYLQLNSKDATLFVYKKTLFEINNDYKKNFILEEHDIFYLNTINQLFAIYYNIILYSILNKDITNDNKKQIIQFSLERAVIILFKIVKMKASPIEKGKKCESILLFYDSIKTTFTITRRLLSFM